MFDAPQFLASDGNVDKSADSICVSLASMVYPLQVYAGDFDPATVTGKLPHLHQAAAAKTEERRPQQQHAQLPRLLAPGWHVAHSLDINTSISILRTCVSL
jgi:hypothetical protein